jgi:hypothetical protein
MLGGLFGGSGGSGMSTNSVGSLGSLGLSGGRASGGPVSAGSAYLVGEKGPEILRMGSQGGNIIPNDAIGGSKSAPAQQFHFQIDARGTDASVSAKIEDGVRRAVKMSVSAVQSSANRGGSFAKSLGRA